MKYLGHMSKRGRAIRYTRYDNYWRITIIIVDKDGRFGNLWKLREGQIASR